MMGIEPGWMNMVDTNSQQMVANWIERNANDNKKKDGEYIQYTKKTSWAKCVCGRCFCAALFVCFQYTAGRVVLY